MRDQAEKLRLQVDSESVTSYVAPLAGSPIITVTSGKGGVGKTAISLNLAAALAAFPKKVFLADADVGFGGFDAAAGIKGERKEPEDFIDDVVMRKAIVDGPFGMKILPAPVKDPFIIESDRIFRESMVRSIMNITREGDLTIVDTPGGAGAWNIEFAMVSDLVFLVTTTDPASLADTTDMLRFLSQRISPARMRLIVNMVEKDDDLKMLENFLSGLRNDFIDESVTKTGGIIRKSRCVEMAMRNQEFFLLEFPDCEASEDILMLAEFTDRFLEFHGSSFREGGLNYGG